MFYLLLDKLRDWLVEHQCYWLFRALDQIQFRAFAAAGLSFLLVVLLGKRTIRWLLRQKIGDTGSTDAEALRNHAGGKANVPTMGGVLIVGAIVASTLLLADIREVYVYLGLVVTLWLAVLGGFDDWLKLTEKKRGSGSRQGLYGWEKLAFQFGLGLLVGWFLLRQGTGDHDLRHVLNLPFQKTYVDAGQLNPSLYFLGGTVFVIVAILMIAGMSNAVNITDGMDGLAGGISAIVSIGLVVLALVAGNQGIAQYLFVPYVPGAEEVAVLAAATGGACLGFLWWNCSPAQVFMGDTGALSLGGVIGYVALVTRQEIVVLVMSGVFLFEILSVVMQVAYFKSTGGKRIFKVAPYHHHLHLCGWPEPQVVSRLWIVSVLLVIIALGSIKVR